MRTASLVLLAAYIVVAAALSVEITKRADEGHDLIADTAPPWRRTLPTATVLLGDIVETEPIVAEFLRAEPVGDTAPPWRRMAPTGARVSEANDTPA
ncbi:hypothetical protein C8R47DRAFT_1277436 [Mycena vitilis]|nr:hypothetical protein C8R47DRAFT_1277436 [Mycena vitilis]